MIDKEEETMNKPVILVWVCLALLAVACSRKDNPEQPAAEGVPVAFGVEAPTKAGFVGEVDPLTIRATGFGVYGYVTSGTNWASGGASAKPHFMTNQRISYEGVQGWAYRPLKYWPNVANVGGAVQDYVSFFAYAPYVSLDDVPSATGITSLPGESTTGTPKIGYQVPENPAYGVDLMVGVAASAHVEPAVTAGAPFLNMTRMTVGEKMDYRFVHTLTRLKITVNAVCDEPVDWNNTRVVLESVSLGVAGQALYTQGTLNLETAQWESTGGRVGDLSALIPTDLRYVSGNTGSVAYFTQQPLGINGTSRSLFGFGVDGTSDAELLYIPGASSADPLSLTVRYHVIERNAGQALGYRSMSITKTVEPDAHFTVGATTTLALHLQIPVSD